MMSTNLFITAQGAAQKKDDAVESVSSFWKDENVQLWLIERPIRIGLIIILAVIAHWALRHLINRLAKNSIKAATLKKPSLIRTKSGEAREGQPNETLRETREARRASRIKTLADVGRSAVAIVVWVSAGIAVLDELDVNVAPLIASAGVIGVALGFGAQELVRDFLSGIFMLIEDQYGIGDVIDLGNGVFGDVESISLRITTVRDIDGALWYVRNGEILRVANHSDEYSVARIQIPVGLSNDPEVAGEVIDKAVKDAVKDEKIRKMVLSTPRIDGMSKFEPDYVSFRVSTKTLPGRQWDVQRFVQSRVLNVMHAEGITTPYPHGIGIANPRKKDDA
ncbi:mechanosensitive ion channel [Corynebacterium macginleyi]|uniref:mechanosensitive ion channel family protein n=1 Tax=Corynebacterium macginleyi TaxID=38290 RepID=UPI00190CD9C9|nr:mechanosensitive ion channel family protein [Corynebacterium macginleyi]MBK4162328.1 mechanosensitive ion channel [Corynebacterium macginleyi]